ncbi:MAG: hypothetical protein ACFE9I_14850 [Candidatus Hermodarchaeota archaeon]
MNINQMEYQLYLFHDIIPKSQYKLYFLLEVIKTKRKLIEKMVPAISREIILTIGGILK